VRQYADKLRKFLQIKVSVMLRKYVHIAVLSGVVMTASAPSAYSQTMTLVNASAATTNNLLNLGTAGFNGYVSGTAFTANFTGFTGTVGFTGASGIVHGANIGWSVGGIGGGAWAPAIGGAAITSNYMVAAQGTITLNLSASVTNFQFLWGSPGFGDTVTLYNGTTQVAQFNGAQVNAANVSFNNAVGTTVITNLQTNNGNTFNRVAISNPTSNFEFALQTTLATAPTSVGTNTGNGTGGGIVIGAAVPSPAPFPMLGATLFGNFAALFGMFAMWRKKRNQKLALANC
jgi:hypothetical protein